MISKEQVINRLRAAKFRHNRQGKRVDLCRQDGTGRVVAVPRRDFLPEKTVQIILAQAGLNKKEIEDFLATCVKS